MTVTQKDIDNLIDNAEIQEFTVFDKCLVVCYKFQNGFVITESSACVDPANFDAEIGRKICRERVENKLWELEEYYLQKSSYRPKKTIEEINKSIEEMNPTARRIYDSLIKAFESGLGG